MTLPNGLNLFTSHPRLWRDNRYVYPVVSRRSRGLSIGVNLNPDKACNFDCVYCSVDRKEPPTVTHVDLDVLREELTKTIALLPDEIWGCEPFNQSTPPHLRRFNDVAFSGDGEPTSFPQFQTSCELVAKVLYEHGWSDSVKIVVITNATLLHVPHVSEALKFLDRHHGEIWAKLDAGTDGYYHLIERTKIPLRRVLGNILECGRERPIVIQSLFMNLHDHPPPPEEIDAYIERLRELRDGGCQIKLVQVYTVARQTAESFVTPLDSARIDMIASRVRDIGLDAESYYGPS